MPFSEILHQPVAQDRLQRALRTDRVPHAYLFTGPAGVGKEMLANRLAAVLLCCEPQDVPAPDAPDADTSHRQNGEMSEECDLQPALAKRPPPNVNRQSSIVNRQSSIVNQSGSVPTWLDACGRCADCVLLAAGNHPDFHRIERTLNKAHPDKQVRNRKAIELSVDVIRHFLIAKAGLRPSRDRAKVFVIADAHRMSNGAQNALLKTLEEPPGHSYLILLASSADALLATTRSRCQQIAFRTLPMRFIIQRLLARGGLTPESARFLAELSQGSLGLALRYAEIGLFDRLPTLFQALQAAPANPLNLAKTLVDTAKDLTPAFKDQGDEDVGTNAARAAQTVVLAMVSALLRDVHRIASGHTAVALPNRPGIAALARATCSEAVGRGIRAVASAEYQIGRSANTSLVFDAVGIELGRSLAPPATRRAPST